MANERAEPRKVFETNLPMIRSILEGVCTRNRLSPEDSEDFSAYALLRLIENDYAVIARFAGLSSLRTYLIAVTCRMLLDYRNQRWGKWRPSSRAKRLGETAVLLETLVERDGCSVEEAITKLLQPSGGTGARQELAELASLIPRRAKRRFEGEERLRTTPAAERADERVLEREEAASTRRVRHALRNALAALTLEERSILSLRFRDGFTVRQIALSLNVEASILYWRIERSLRLLRASMTQSLTRETIEAVLREEARS